MMFSAIVSFSFLAALTAVSSAPLDEQTVIPGTTGISVYSHCTVPNTVAFTFDDGPYKYTTNVVEMLDTFAAKGTFFFNGNNYGCIYSGDNLDKVRHVVNQGHQVASHTWSHKNLTTLNWDAIHDEFWRVEQALMRIAGVKPAFMRPPYGKYNNQVLQVATMRHQNIVLWDLDSGDSQGKSPEESKAIYDEALRRHPSSVLALNNEPHAETVLNVLPHALQIFRDAGYHLVTVAQCLNLPPYQWVGKPQSGSWTC